MTSKHSNQYSRRYPLKRVRPDNENCGSILSSNSKSNKKLCRQPSQDSAFVETEKSSDERAFDLFYKEYYSQIRPYFKHSSIALQLLEHLWTNLIESSKVSFVKKILKEQGTYDLSSPSSSIYNDENDYQLNKCLNQSNQINSTNKYNRTFLNDFLVYLKHNITPRDLENNVTTKLITPVRRSSRIRRAPIKCLCTTCITTGGNQEHAPLNDDPQNNLIRQLIEKYHQLDDQYNSTSLISENENENSTSQIDLTVSQVEEKEETNTETSVSIDSMLSTNSSDQPLPSFDFLINSSPITNEKCDSLTMNECSTRRTFVILTELDEPFFGPYPIEFTITI